MANHVREYVVLETAQRSFCLEMAKDGTLYLEKDPQCLKDRYSQAEVMNSADCRERNITVQDLRMHLSTFRPNSDSFARDLYGFLSGESLSEEISDAVHPEEQQHDNQGRASCKDNATSFASPATSQAPCLDCSVPFGADDEILARFREDGFVVVSGVYSDELVTSALNELWESRCLLGRDSAIKRDDRNTWGSEHWPQQDGGRNFLQSLDSYQDRSCWEIGQHPNAVHVMRLLWGDQGVKDLILQEPPRWGVMRPTGRNPEWRTDESWLHWDQNPWTEPGFGRVQAFACLTDQTPTSGGLLCAPGFQRRWRQWGESHPEGTVFVDGQQITREFGNNKPFPVPSDDPVHTEVARVLAPRGSLVLWDGRLPHQNFPNTGEEFRVVLYINFSPSSEALLEERKQQLCRKLVALRALHHVGFWPQGLTALGRTITGSPGAQAIIEADKQLTEEPRLGQAIKLAVEAGDAELEGDLNASVAKFRRSEKVYPDIGKWHDVIFA